MEGPNIFNATFETAIIATDLICDDSASVLGTVITLKIMVMAMSIISMNFDCQWYARSWCVWF